MWARPRVPTVQVWQYTGQALLRVPAWISRCTEMHSDGLYLVRSSGKQRIETSEWLVEETDGNPLWLTDVEFNAEYELAPGFTPEAA